ncbi:hypothetical protein BDR05DRAFT_950285 [Suillus weaverae]|nr:hypothetical protein BDR05DRAFT_950285 [Suillus weaverae]
MPPVPPAPHHSSHVPVPSEKHCAMEGKPFVSAVQHAIHEASVFTERLQGLLPCPSLPSSTSPEAVPDAFAATLSEEELAHLADLFVTMPDHLTNEMSDDPSTYSEAMASPHAAQWISALQKEFSSLRDLGVFKLVPRSTVPPGCKVMCGHPVFKLKHDYNGNPARFKAHYVCKG